MSNQIHARVLWVDEENDPVGFINLARRYDIIVYRYGSWEEARDILDRRFDAFSAVVLDGNSVIMQGDKPNSDFLYQVVRELETIYAQHEESLPWYVLSSGSAPDFAQTLRRIAMGNRDTMTDTWGPLFYHKNADEDVLCKTICRMVSMRKENKIAQMYRPVFETLKRYFDSQSCNTMLEILMALHYPETKRDFDPVLYYTQLRRILEQLFRAANRLHIIPDNVLGENNKVNLSNSSLYLAGRDVYLGKGCNARYGEPGESFFPSVISQLVKSILVVANKNSHTTELNNQEAGVIRDYYDTMRSNNLLFGYTWHLCDVIAWFGDNAERNFKK